MSVLLEIPDGNPWWLSPNLWTVPEMIPKGQQDYLLSGNLPICGQRLRIMELMGLLMLLCVSTGLTLQLDLTGIQQT